MGFINPGKSLRKRKRRNDSTSSPSSSPLSSSSSSSSPSPSPSLPTDTPHDKLTLDTLPVEIIEKIFLHIGPHENNLPLVNKRLYWILHLENNYEYGTSYNFGLLEKMVRRYFLIDLNSRIDFETVEMKIDYYESQESLLQQNYPNYHKSVQWERFNTNLFILKDALEQFEEYGPALLSDILNFEFISENTLFMFKLGEYFGSSLGIKSSSEALLIQKSRLRFIRLKFKELAYNIKKAREELEREDFHHEVIIDPGNISSLLSEEPEDEFNPELKYYQDENLPTDGFRSYISERYIEFKDGFFCFNEDFEYSDRSASGSSRIPDHCFVKAVYSKKHYDLLSYLKDKHTFGDIINGPAVMSRILDILENPAHRSSRKWTQQLVDIVDMIKFFNCRIYKFTDVVVRLFELYDKVSKDDFSSISDPEESFPNAIARIIVSLLQYIFSPNPRTIHNNDDKRELWITAMTLKNIYLTDLLRKFEGDPDYDILHRFG
ncbi:hypothetical protein SBY92_005140 [Candida maltosa Xu316]